MPAILTTRQRDLISAVVAIVGFIAATIIELQGQHHLALHVVTGTVFGTAALNLIAPPRRQMTPARQNYWRLLALWMLGFTLLFGAIVFLVVRLHVPNRAWTLAWVGCAILAIYQLVWALRQPRFNV